MKLKLSGLVVSLLLILATSVFADGTSASGNREFDQFLAQWDKAQQQFINGDPTLWKQLCSHSADATILGGFGGVEPKGWASVGARYDWASSQYRKGQASMKVEYVNVVVGRDLAYTVGIERQESAQVGDAAPTKRALRVTQVFRKEDGAWKLLHRHADPLVERQTPSK